MLSHCLRHVTIFYFQHIFSFLGPIHAITFWLCYPKYVPYNRLQFTVPVQLSKVD